ncbi:MAG: methyltransferase domain-containing protein [Clostridia bacterium]|nr:methyltransferase domain-containing protein [Clostridia bacterium]
MFNNIHAFIELVLDKHLGKGDIVVDATLGNGKDAFKLLERIGAEGFLYGFDIQPQAIESSDAHLKANGYANYQLHLASHELMSNYVEADAVQVILFNLGYLPKGDKTITTSLNGTVTAIREGLKLLKKNGMMLVACYPGHEEGYEEYQGLLDALPKLDQKAYNLFHGSFLNQKNMPPAIFLIEKIL